MTLLETKNFGRISYEAQSALEFPCGLPGFEGRRQFVAVRFPENDPLIYLQSLEDPALCFITMPILAVDPQYANLLNQGNITKLNGNLHIEAICQSPVHSDVPAAMVSCGSFHGTVPIPPNGAYVQVTGVYLEDNDHGWMEIHPISALLILR